MTNLVGTGAFCSTGVGIEDTKNEGFKVYPNPFKTHIYLSTDKEVTLVNELGQIIFAGKNIEKQDFSDLPKGIYFLKIGTSTTHTTGKEIIKMIKE